ncbi:MAG TPA: VWA domain-containing protein [Elusimicrobia bacterium]|nr:VWA domain-containing protein [Elusimicrobiota bacterium]
MRKLAGIAAGLVLVAALGGAAHAEPLKSLAKRLEKGLKSSPNKKVAVLNFAYPGGALTEGSVVVQERLTTHLVQSGRLEVIERNLLKKVLEEMKLEATGLIDAETTKRLGKVLGVGALVTGTLNDLQDGKAELNARAIDAETGLILAAGQAVLKRTWSDARLPVPVEEPSVSTSAPRPQFLGKPLVQIALLLDTSNSMDGLINQAKAQLWKVVNELSSGEREGRRPDLQVALYEYGNDSLDAGKGWIRQVVPFTSDLDKVSEQLFALRTNGGSEFAGQVIHEAVLKLDWDRHADVYKAVFIAGNEPFTQGPVPFEGAAAEARRKGVVVNTIFCGSRQEGAAGQWLAGAQAGGGDYFNIDQGVQTVSVPAPQDAEIEKLGRELNTTYVPLGDAGRGSARRQEAQDKNALSFAAAGASVQRAMFKAAPQYASAAAEWDAVTMVSEGKLDAKGLQEKELPAELKALPLEKLEAQMREKVQKRKELQARIQKLSAERSRFISKKQSEGGAQTLDQALLAAVRTQAAKKRLIIKTN